MDILNTDGVSCDLFGDLSVKLIFGIGAGFLTFAIRYFGVYPEGVSFAILFMNILTPYIDSWTKHKIFGVGGKNA